MVGYLPRKRLSIEKVLVSSAVTRTEKLVCLSITCLREIAWQSRERDLTRSRDLPYRVAWQLEASANSNNIGDHIQAMPLVPFKLKKANAPTRLAYFDPQPSWGDLALENPQTV
jgi:hypothetical protein